LFRVIRAGNFAGVIRFVRNFIRGLFEEKGKAEGLKDGNLNIGFFFFLGLDGGVLAEGE
jgi:hypothetical protein